MRLLLKGERMKAVKIIDKNEMMKEYIKGGKFMDYVDKACFMYKDTVEEELEKATVQEYYRSIKDGTNKERS